MHNVFQIDYENTQFNQSSAQNVALNGTSTEKGLLEGEHELT